MEADVFLLTAAHVTDFSKLGTLLIPGEGHLMSVAGYFSHIPIRSGATREDDKGDIAYYRLLPRCRDHLDSRLRILEREDVSLFDSLGKNDLYTFVGFPYRKTKTRGATLETALSTYTSVVAPATQYQQLGYDAFAHVLIQYRRKKSVSFHDGSIGIGPHPQGVSGGGVFSWPKDLQQRPDNRNPKLVAIAHSYHENQNIMAATRINPYVTAILRNSRSLDGSHPAAVTDAPLACNSLVCYAEEEWDQLLSSVDDPENMHATWNEWRQAATELLEQSSSFGITLVPILLHVAKIVEYCAERDIRNTSQARNEMAASILSAMMTEQFHQPEP
jgi:hypothetical protein